METEIAGLRGQLARHGRGQTAPELRRRAATVATELRRTGASWQEVGVRLGVRAETVRRWCVGRKRQGRHQGEAPRAVLPVEIVTDPSTATLSIVSPSGYRVEGLSVEQATALMLRLR